MLPILFHINYFEQGQTPEMACRIARKFGADGIEFRRKPAGFAKLDLHYLDDVARALDKEPLEWVSFGGPGVNLMSEDCETRARELDAAEAFYRKAARLFPLRIVNAFSGILANSDKTLPFEHYWNHGSAIATEEHWENAVNGFKRLGTLAGDLGFRFAFETHGVHLHDTIPASMRLVNRIGSEQIGLLWDHANLMLFKEAPSFTEVIEALGEKMFYVHLKNLLVEPSRFLMISNLNDGIINIREQLRELLASGYRGPLCIESPRPGDREYYAQKDMEYLRQVVADLTSGSR